MKCHPERREGAKARGDSRVREVTVSEQERMYLKASPLTGGSVSRGRLVIALIVAVISILGYYGSSVFNPITQEKQHVAGITPEQEVALGLQAAPEMAQQFGGEDPDPRV